MTGGPMAELETMDMAVIDAGIDEHKTCFDPECHPKAPKRSDDPVVPPLDFDETALDPI